MKTDNRYNDIINLPHHVSKFHKQMSVYDRAAQFSPFAALKGYDEEIDEAARYTEERLQLDDEFIGELNSKLLTLKGCEKQRPLVKLTYFKPDSKKQGGAYVKVEQTLKKIDEYNRIIVFTDGTKVNFRDLISVDIV